MNEPAAADRHRAVPARVLERIVEVACRAPSVHNTQPWRWRGTDHTLELYADRTRQLSQTDTRGRNLTISCGAALHHAQVAAGALGWAVEVARPLDRDRPDLLARLDLVPATVPAAAEETLDALENRCTDRRRFTSWPIPEERLAHLARIANEWGARAVPLTDESEHFIVERLVRHADHRQRASGLTTLEQRAWQDRSAVDGVPLRLVHGATDRAGAHPHRAEGATRLQQESRDVEASDGLIALFDTHDDPRAWLRAGEGLSAMWLAATSTGLSVVPLSHVMEVPDTRRAFQTQVLGGLAYPLLLVKIGWRANGRDEPPRTPRRPVSAVLEIT